MTAIDTLSIQRRLKDAGFAEAQATALTDMVRDVVSGYAATKGDLENVRADLKNEIHKLRDEMTIRFGVMMSAGLTLLFVALRYTPA